MSVFDVLTLIGGLCLFLFGMNLMGQALERRAGGSLQKMLGKLTTGKVAGLLTGLGVTAVIQSSSATTVMVVGFVNSGLMTLRQAINVIMGANIGTTVTAWILSLGGIDSKNVFVQLLKPTSFTPILALIGIIFYMFCKSDKKKDNGVILLGFATLMFGMDAMSGAVSGLKNVPEFQQLFLLFENPIFGVLAGAILTAIIQSSSASVGILQTLSTTGSVTYAAAIPIIMGQNIGTCITAMISSVGANKNAKRAAMVHLAFNVIGTTIMLIVFCIVQAVFNPILLSMNTTHTGIAIAHSVFNVVCTLLLLPMSGLLEKLVIKLVPDAKTPEVVTELDSRLLATPAVALENCHNLVLEMADCATTSMNQSIECLITFSPELVEKIREAEDRTDHLEDVIGSYLVDLSARQLSAEQSAEAAKLLRIIGDYERVADHSVNLLCSAEEMKTKGLDFSGQALEELKVLCAAVNESLALSTKAFLGNDLQAAQEVEALEETIDDLKESMRRRHIVRLQQGQCSIEAGFVWADILTNLERTSDHCSNIAGCVMETAHNQMALHESLREIRHDNGSYIDKYREYRKKYSIKDI